MMGFKTAVVSVALFALTFGAAVSTDLDEHINDLSVRDDAFGFGRGSRIIIKQPRKKITTTLIVTTTTVQYPTTVLEGTLKQIIGPTTKVVTTLVTKVLDAPASPVVETSSETTTASSVVKTSSRTTTSPEPVTTVVEELTCVKDGKDVVDACRAKIFKPDCPPDDEFCVKNCSMDDPHCHCSALKELEECVKGCEFDRRYASIQIARKQLCEQSYVREAQAGNPKLRPTATITSTATWTEFRTLTIKQVYSTPLATEILYNHGAGRVVLWTGKAGHTHVPSIIEKVVDGEKAFETINAKSGSPESDRQVSALMAVVGGAMGMVAAML